MKMIARGRMNERVICVKSFFDEKIVLNDWLNMPMNPTNFMSSSVRSMAISG
ncbi:hypothetical protein HanRHA438_Chr05g0244491 [Helianthus annuus]|nr:hypothetical protein HanRHA438_Chr05g0244491 [Helianthus annuus]